MGTTTKRLSSRFVDTVSKPGMHADGAGLYLVVSPAGAKRWTFIFNWRGKATKQKRAEMGLGKLSTVSLAEARLLAEDARRSVARGENPIEARALAREKALGAQGRGTFGEFADKLVDELAPQFRNEKHIEQWRTTFKVHAGPIRHLAPEQIDTEAVLKVLRPLWQSTPETGSRVRGRLERALDAAKAAGLREGENPARWRGHLVAILPKRQKLTRGHHAAMPYAMLPAFLETLSNVQGLGSQALKFLILTASRTGEVIGARWNEIDWANAVWTVPAERMKAGREHRVPLTTSAVAWLEELHDARLGEFIFAATRRGPISNMTLAKALNAAGGNAYTVHGFRSTFRDWVGEETNFAEPIAEAALAHVVGDATERAYRRGDALAKRRTMMEAWERYSLTNTSNVVPIRTGK